MSASLPIDAVLIALVAAITQFAKTYIELWLKPTNPLHDNTIRLFAVLLAIGLRLLDLGLPVSGPDVVTLLGYGIGTGLAAIGAYHIISDSAPTPSVPPMLSAPPPLALNANPTRPITPEPPAPSPAPVPVAPSGATPPAA